MKKSNKKTVSKTTKLLNDAPHAMGAVAPPIYQSSLFTFDDYKTLESVYAGEIDQPIYSRVGNPTVTLFEDKMAELEGGEAAIAFASGMAAISTVILGLMEAGDKLVAVNHIYPDTYRLLSDVCTRFGATAHFVNGQDLAAIEEQIIGAKFLYLESPSTWVMEEQNLCAIAKLAKKHDVLTLIDNSWASPLFQTPLAMGIDIVIHSASKYLSGHSDVVAGVAIGSNKLMTKIRNETNTFLGAKLSAHEAGLLVRGLRTLPLRLQQHNDSGMFIAKKLVSHPYVSKVNHPGINKQKFSALTGYGSLFSFEVTDTIDIPTFCDALGLFRLGVSWGGYESLIMPAAPGIQKGGRFNSAIDFGISKRLIRLFVGLEEKQDLWADIEDALNQSVK